MPQLLCPICQKALSRSEHAWVCADGHSFDIARQGYVNLLPVYQKHSLHPGDAKNQVTARRVFLDGGFYAPLAQRLSSLALEFAPHTQAILDLGCGEGYYSAKVAQGFPEAALCGIDISKDAVRLASGKYKNGLWVCGTSAHLPFPDQSFSLLLNLFAPCLPEEFRRVAKDGAIMLQVLAGADHLTGLKSTIYPELLDREKNLCPELPGFRMLKSEPLRFDFVAEGPQVQNLLAMTPHFWRISKDGAERLEALTRLEDTASVVINVYEAV